MADRTGGYRGVDERLLQLRLDRVDFLRLIGAGATLPFVPMSLAARPSSAQTIPSLTPADLVAGGEFPIGAWWPPPPQSKDPDPSYTREQRYEQVRQAGFNFVIGGNGVTNDASIAEALEAAEENDLKFLLTDDPGDKIVGLQDLIGGDDTGDTGDTGTEDAEPGIMQYMNEQDDPASAPDGTASNLARSTVQEKIRERVQYLVNRYTVEAQYPALAGINLYDEPSRSMFGRLKFAGTEVREQFPDTQNLSYANVNPSYSSRKRLGTRTYADYLDLYLKGEDRLPLLSFDHYPLLTQGGTTDDYYYNWAAIRSRALKYRIPSWIFIQSVDFRGTVISPPRRRPNKAELYWQVNVSLAYGAKGIQYFTYWTPADYLKNGLTLYYGEALISRETGQPTQTYDRASEVNEYLKAVGKQLLPLTSELVMHTRVKRARPGVRPFKADGWLRAAGGSPVILGRFFENSLQDPERYLLVANRSLANAAIARLTVSDSVREVSRFDATSTGPDPYVPVMLGTSPRSFQVDLEPGRAELYRLRRTG